MKEAQHPVDFGPYLDGERTDASYEGLRVHLESCPACRARLESWQSVDSLFRSPELDIEVSPWQWSRIESRLDDTRPAPGWLPWFRQLAPRFAWAAAAVVVLFASIAVVQIRQNRHSAEQETLVALAQYAEAEQLRLRDAANPFRSDSTNLGNPFTHLQFDGIEKRNPFVRR